MGRPRQFGARPSPSDIERYAQSKQWNGSIFENTEPTKVDVDIYTIPKLLYKQIFERQKKAPPSMLPILPFDKIGFERPGDDFRAIWFGHSAILMRLNQCNMFIDPMLGDNAAPISPFPVKRFSEKTLDIIDGLPELELVLISHDHYDHLDYESIVKINKKTKRFFVALGDARHLIRWGVSESRITEFDWWDEQVVNGIKITFTPSRHFSGRGLRDRSKSLWGGWVFDSGSEKIWFSGDGGYGTHFTEIADRFGSFDFAFMECGQYHELWHLIHMYPEEAVQAAIDAKAKITMPVHWGAFALSLHTWTDPVVRYAAEAQQKGIGYILPRLGQEITLRSNMQTKWWEEV